MSVDVTLDETDSGSTPGNGFRRLDHVGIAVWDADASIPYYRDVIGLELAGDEVAIEPGSRLVYFKAAAGILKSLNPGFG